MSLPSDEPGFREQGERFLKLFINLGRLKPHEAVLDVGCGRGRMAVPLARTLDPGVRYEGFDVNARAIESCRKSVSAAGFRFTHVDVANVAYNPDGAVAASSFSFPYEDSSFEFVAMVSVLTHMVPPEAARYLAEAARVLRPGGRCFATLFILGGDAERCRRKFPHDFGEWRSSTDDPPGRAVAFEASLVRKLIPPLRIVEPIYPGAWSGNAEALSDQDIVIAIKD